MDEKRSHGSVPEYTEMDGASLSGHDSMSQTDAFLVALKETYVALQERSRTISSHTVFEALLRISRAFNFFQRIAPKWSEYTGGTGLSNDMYHRLSILGAPSLAYLFAYYTAVEDIYSHIMGSTDDSRALYSVLNPPYGTLHVDDESRRECTSGHASVPSDSFLTAIQKKLLSALIFFDIVREQRICAAREPPSHSSNSYLEAMKRVVIPSMFSCLENNWFQCCVVYDDKRNQPLIRCLEKAAATETQGTAEKLPKQTRQVLHTAAYRPMDYQYLLQCINLGNVLKLCDALSVQPYRSSKPSEKTEAHSNGVTPHQRNNTTSASNAAFHDTPKPPKDVSQVSHNSLFNGNLSSSITCAAMTTPPELSSNPEEKMRRLGISGSQRPADPMRKRYAKPSYKPLGEKSDAFVNLFDLIRLLLEPPCDQDNEIQDKEQPVQRPPTSSIGASQNVKNTTSLHSLCRAAQLHEEHNANGAGNEVHVNYGDLFMNTSLSLCRESGRSHSAEKKLSNTSIDQPLSEIHSEEFPLDTFNVTVRSEKNRVPDTTRVVRDHAAHYADGRSPPYLSQDSHLCSKCSAVRTEDYTQLTREDMETAEKKRRSTDAARYPVAISKAETRIPGEALFETRVPTIDVCNVPFDGGVSLDVLTKKIHEKAPLDPFPFCGKQSPGFRSSDNPTFDVSEGNKSSGSKVIKRISQRSMKKKNTSTVNLNTPCQGVCWDPTHQRWVAHWSDSKTHQRIRKYFNPKVLGFQRARLHAILTRKEAVDSGRASMMIKTERSRRSLDPSTSSHYQENSNKTPPSARAGTSFKEEPYQALLSSVTKRQRMSATRDGECKTFNWMTTEKSSSDESPGDSYKTPEAYDVHVGSGEPTAAGNSVTETYTPGLYWEPDEQVWYAHWKPSDSTQVKIEAFPVSEFLTEDQTDLRVAVQLAKQAAAQRRASTLNTVVRLEFLETTKRTETVRKRLSIVGSSDVYKSCSAAESSRVSYFPLSVKNSIESNEQNCHKAML